MCPARLYKQRVDEVERDAGRYTACSRMEGHAGDCDFSGDWIELERFPFAILRHDGGAG